MTKSILILGLLVMAGYICMAISFTFLILYFVDFTKFGRYLNSHPVAAVINNVFVFLLCAVVFPLFILGVLYLIVV